MIENNRIWVYTITYNESHFVKNFLTAYKEAERIVVYDNMSTDNTRELLKEDDRVEIRDYYSNGQIRDDLYLSIKNNCWKEARGKADWVIVVDFDEIFTRARIINDVPVLDLDLTDAYYNGWNVFRPYGYNMVSLEAPLYAEGHPFEYSKKGVFHNPAIKMCCFRPDQISEIRFEPGCHTANPLDMDGKIDNVRILMNQDFKLLHYKFWNVDHYMKRMKDYQTRMSNQNKEHGWGWHYLIPLNEHYQMFVCGCDLAKDLFEIVIEGEQPLNLDIKRV